VLSDINPLLINAYRAVRDSPDELLSLLREYQDIYWPLPQPERETYYKAQRDRINAIRSLELGIEAAALLIFLNRTNYNSLMRFSLDGGYNSPPGKYPFPGICNQKVIQSCSKALQGVQLECASFSDILSPGDIPPGSWVFNDPPYIKKKKSSFVGYSKEGFSLSSHRSLTLTLRELIDRDVLTWIANSDTVASLTLYDGLQIFPIYAVRSINSKVEGRVRERELLVVGKRQ
jgi:DNA adenine methylase